MSLAVAIVASALGAYLGWLASCWIVRRIDAFSEWLSVKLGL